MQENGLIIFGAEGHLWHTFWAGGQDQKEAEHSAPLFHFRGNSMTYTPDLSSIFMVTATEINGNQSFRLGGV